MVSEECGEGSCPVGPSHGHQSGDARAAKSQFSRDMFPLPVPPEVRREKTLGRRVAQRVARHIQQTTKEREAVKALNWMAGYKEEFENSQFSPDALQSEARHYLQSPEHMLKPGCETGLGEFQPYWDPLLRRDAKLYKKFIQKLNQAGYLVFTQNPKSFCGVFFVRKSDGRKIRMIIDARGTNSMFRPPPGVDLLTSDGFSRIELNIPSHFVPGSADYDDYLDRHRISIGLSDVKDCFHRLRQPRWLCDYFCLDGVPASWVGLENTYLDNQWLAPDSIVYPAPGSLPMGFTWALYFAQRASEVLMTKVPSLQKSTLVHDRSSAIVFGEGQSVKNEAGEPRPVHHYVYVDNLGVLSVNHDTVETALREVEDVFGSHKLILHPGLVSSGTTKALGCALRGDLLASRVTSDRYHKLRQAIQGVLERKRVSGRILEVLVGHATFVALMNRHVLSVFNTVYRYINAHYHKPAPLWTTVREELSVFRGLMIFLHADWARPWNTYVTATDSSLEGFGVVSSHWQQHEVASAGRNLERARFRKLGSHSARASALTAAGFVHDEATDQWKAGWLDRPSYLEHTGWALAQEFKEIPGYLLQADRWTPRLWGKWQHSAGILELEARALVKGLKRIAMSTFGHDVRQLLLTDNMSVCLAFDRSRARSFSLLVQIRKFAAYCLARNIYCVVRWVPSELNSADKPSGAQQRLKVLSINVNSLSGFLWGEVKAFLGGEGLQYDFIFLQETHRTAFCAFKVDNWMAVGSSTKRGEGVLTLVHPRYDASMVRYQEIIPGRVLRVKVCHKEAAIETLNIYQHVWIHTDDPEQNKQRRQTLLDKCTATIQGMARRDTLILAGDFNSEVHAVNGLIGTRVNRSAYHQALDPLTLPRFIQDNALVALNTWHMKDPCTNYTRTGNSQIDYILVRAPSADTRAKQVVKQEAPFGAWKELTHSALIADVRIIKHFHLPKAKMQQELQYSRHDLDYAYRQKDHRITQLKSKVELEINHSLNHGLPLTADHINHTLLREVSDLFPTATSAHTNRGQTKAQCKAIFAAWKELLTHPDEVGGSTITLPARVYHMWQRRRDLQRCKPFTLSGVLRTWQWVLLFNKAGRQSKQYHLQHQRAIALGHLQQAERAAQTHNTKRLYGAVKRLLPWKPKPRIMLKHPDGSPMSLHQEHQALVQHCKQLFAPPAASPTRPGQMLSMPLTACEWTTQLQCTPIGKAVPADSAPATAWKACATIVAPAMACIAKGLQPVTSALPDAWKNPQLCFLPKPHKPPSTAAALRPIGLLRPDGKAFAGHIKNQLLMQACSSLTHTPQYAYLQARDTSDALARVNACIHDIKDGLRALGGNRFLTRQRKETGQVKGESGGCLLSVDLSQAFDRVNRAKLDRALALHQVDADLRSTVTAIHEQAAYQDRDKFHRTDICTTQGIRQGCRLAPALWAVLSSQLLWDLTPAGQTPLQLPFTLFADDHLGHWLLKTVDDAKQMEETIVALFHMLETYGLKVNPDKSSLVIRVQGAQLEKFVKSRTVIVRNQAHWKLQDGEQTHLIPMCESITYLGTKLTLKEGTGHTLDFRLAEAEAKVTQLRKSIRSRKGLSRHYRVRVWQACVVNSALYGLLTTPFSGQMITKLRAWFHRQLRAVTGMPAHLTKVSNQTLRETYNLNDPVHMLTERIARKLNAMQQGRGDPATCETKTFEYWQMLHKQLASHAVEQRTVTLVELSSSSQHACSICGLYYPTQKALRQHQALRHGQIQANKLSIDYKPEQHSVAGMPQCKHCLLKLYDWGALKGHIMQNVCGWHTKQLSDSNNNSQQDTKTVKETEPVPHKVDTPHTPVDPKERQHEPRNTTTEESTLLQNEATLALLQSHEGICTQAALHKTYLKQHCGFCGRWIADAGMIKTHIQRVHTNLARHITSDIHTSCQAFKHLFKRDHTCEWCDRMVHGSDRHCSQCPVLFQLILARTSRQAASASPETQLPAVWPVPHPGMDVAIYLKSPTQDEMQLHIQHMSTLAKTRCLLCGEQVQDIQHWRRHMAQRHDSQKQLHTLRDLAAGAMSTSQSLLENTDESASLCCSSACTMTSTSVETTPEQQMAAVWGLSSPLATTPTPQRQASVRHRLPQGTPQKYRKGMGKGAGKAAPKAKRDRDQEAEDELMMDLESLDEETVRTALKTLVKTALRHEHQLTILEADRSYVFFLDTTNHGIVSMLIQASATWNTKFEECTVNTSLRATLWGVLLMEWKARLEKIESDAKVLQVAETAGWATRSPLQWIYNEWNPVQKKALPSSRDNLTHEEAKKAVNQLIANTAKDNTVHRFQSLRPLKPDLQAEVITMVLTLTVHQQAAAVYHDLDLLANNCAGKLIGLRLRRERVGKTTLTKELERLQI
ncbi:unnamed protein product [Symbiodinium natans]|uniref:Reverse transcriptase domain-containing protein n=1 Tax=Symbiodinium natans TaxID=878477 RepID=A0A812N4V3_9DINO|nr:unnamed protein product [Symbiodinium natans]